MKVNIIDKIQAALPDIRWNRMKKVNIVIDEIIYKLTDRGFSYNGRVTLAKKLEVGLSTVDKAFSLLKQTGLFVFAYRENPASNSAKTPVIFYVKHEKYKTFESMVPELQDEYIEQGLSRIEKYNKQD
jgi:DNA-binding transcriptional regulator YhcF (GntR family)